MKQFIFWIMVFIFSSCKHEENVLPAGLIDKDRFVEVMKDKALSEAALNVNPKNVDGTKYDSVYNFRVYEENKITRAQYDSTLIYYSSHPDEFKEVLEAVLEKLNIEKAKR